MSLRIETTLRTKACDMPSLSMSRSIWCPVNPSWRREKLLNTVLWLRHLVMPISCNFLHSIHCSVWCIDFFFHIFDHFFHRRWPAEKHPRSAVRGGAQATHVAPTHRLLPLGRPGLQLGGGDSLPTGQGRGHRLSHPNVRHRHDRQSGCSRGPHCTSCVFFFIMKKKTEKNPLGIKWSMEKSSYHKMIHGKKSFWHKMIHGKISCDKMTHEKKSSWHKMIHGKKSFWYKMIHGKSSLEGKLMCDCWIYIFWGFFLRLRLTSSRSITRSFSRRTRRWPRWTRWSTIWRATISRPFELPLVRGFWWV